MKLSNQQKVDPAKAINKAVRINEVKRSANSRNEHKVHEPLVTETELRTMLKVSHTALFYARCHDRIPPPDSWLRPLRGGQLRPLWCMSVARALVAKRNELFPKAKQ